MADRKKVLILGGGFGGIKTALELSGHPAFDVTLISDQDNFRYYPRLYKTATGGRQAASEIPLAEIFASKDVQVVKDVVLKLDRLSKKIICVSDKEYAYDFLIVALGVVTNFFGIKGLDKYSYGIKTPDDARRLRDHLHKALVEEKRPDISYVVIGGGPSGVELAGALPSYIRHIMNRHNLAPRPAHIDLVEAESRILPRMPKDYSLAATKRLRRLGVLLHLDEKVLAETADKLMVTGHSIASHTVIWTAGVTNHPFLGSNKFPLTKSGRAHIDQYLQPEANIYVIGDNADTKYSGMAQTALYDGKFVAENLKRQANDQAQQTYRAKKPIYMTPVGPHWAAVLWGKTHIYGWGGWLLRNLADFAAYHQYEPWWKASKRWQATFENEETCPICK
ncbi:MAG: FAD-dependent oxidoreductase [bacterium]|nr:FAD-dependent oxidoreductase [bacterium]